MFIAAIARQTDLRQEIHVSLSQINNRDLLADFVECNRQHGPPTGGRSCFRTIAINMDLLPEVDPAFAPFL